MLRNQRKVFVYDAGLTCKDVAQNEVRTLLRDERVMNTDGKRNNASNVNRQETCVFGFQKHTKAEDICSAGHEDGIQLEKLICMDIITVLSGIEDAGKALLADDYTKSDDSWRQYV